MRIKTLVKQVRETAAGKSISAYVVLDKKGKPKAYIHVFHTINNKGHLKRVDVFEPGVKDGFNQYKGRDIESALHRAVICGVRLYGSDGGAFGAETEAMLKQYQRALSDAKRGQLVRLALKRGMAFYNPGPDGFQSCGFMCGLSRLEAFGYTVILAF